MNWKKLGHRTRFGFQYFPLTLNCILLAIAVFWCFKKLEGAKATPDAPSSFAPFLILMGKSALWLFLALVAFCLLSVILCYFQFLWLRKKKKAGVALTFDQKEHSKNTSVKALLESARRPWLGAVRCRLIYDDGLLTSKLTLLGNYREKNHFFRKGISGKQLLQLPDIKTYRLQGSFLYFEDLLHLFSLAAFVPQRGNFFQPPRSRKSEYKEEQPQQVFQEDIRVEESRPVAGDYANYKNFEGGDDIRRIVWQVYAKSRELVVRVPEIKDFYASHLNFYASFHSSFSAIQLNNAFAAEMLNYFKNGVWTAVETLIRKEIPVKFIPDQNLETGELLGQEKQIQMTISNAQWQFEKGLADYLHVNGNGIVCISSLNNPEEIAQLLESSGKSTLVYFFPLSQAFRHWASWGWLKRLFVKTPTDRLKRIRSSWVFSPLRYKLIRREKKIRKQLVEHDVRFGILN